MQEFVGRERELRQLDESLQRHDRVALTSPKYRSGIGKTELAIHYAGQTRARYTGGICWIQAQGPIVAVQLLEYVQLYLKLVPPAGLSAVDQVQWSWQVWIPGDVLLILDEVKDVFSIQPYLPPQDPRFKVLMTTELTDVPLFKTVALDELSLEACLELLESHIGAARLMPEQGSAITLCNWMGRVPLGVQLVGSYLKYRTGLSPTDVLSQLQRCSQSQAPTYPGLQDLPGIQSILDLMWRTLSKDARDLACLLCVFGPTAIPWDLVQKSWDQRRLGGHPLWRLLLTLINWLKQTDARKTEALREAQLIPLQLLTSDHQGYFQYHSLVHQYFQMRLAQHPRRGSLKQAVLKTMILAAEEIPQALTREVLERIQPQIPHLAMVGQRWLADLTDDDVMWPFVGMGRYYQGQGFYELAEPWYVECVKVCQRRFGKEHRSMAASLNNLAELYRDQKQYKQAEPLYRQALQITRRSMDIEDPTVATSINNLAYLYSLQERYDQAEPLYREVLAIREHYLEPEHPDVFKSLNDLAMVYEMQGQYAEAEPLFKRALHLRQHRLGPDHPAVSISLNSLAFVYERQGQHEQAEPLLVQALQLRRRALGTYHPSVAVSLNNLAALYSAQRRYDEAEPLYQQALDIWERLLGTDHPDIATSLNNLALLYASTGRYVDAERLYIRSIDILTHRLGQDHPHTQTGWENYLLCLKAAIQADGPVLRELMTQGSKMTQRILTQLQTET